MTALFGVPSEHPSFLKIMYHNCFLTKRKVGEAFRLSGNIRSLVNPLVPLPPFLTIYLSLMSTWYTFFSNQLFTYRLFIFKRILDTQSFSSSSVRSPSSINSQLDSDESRVTNNSDIKLDNPLKSVILK